MINKRRLFIFVLMVLTTCLAAVTEIEITKTQTPPKIDGVLDDAVWKIAKGYSTFISFQPEFGRQPEEKTVAYAAYDSDNLYFAFKCFDREPNKIIASLQKRDARTRDDAISLFLDSHDDGQNSYFFQCNPLGVQRDGVMNSQALADSSQDFVWESHGKINADGYCVEYKIPFKSLRFPKCKMVTMRIAFLRKISRYSYQYTFPAWELGDGSIIDQFVKIKLAEIRSSRVFEVLPSFTYSDQRKRDDDWQLVQPDDKQVHLGMTTKVGLTSDLMLDVALNPDFSHIESDQGQVEVNLRNPALYQEKRPFFLEGLEHFHIAGTGDASPIEMLVHTRNIIDPSLGIKLSGRTSRSGIVNSLFAIDRGAKLDSNDKTGVKNYFGIFRYKQLFKSDSYIGGIYTSKEYNGGYLRVGGLDTRMRLSGKMFLDAYFLYSFDKESENTAQIKGPAYGGQLTFEDTKTYATLNYHESSQDFKLDPGRLLRYEGIRKFAVHGERFFYFTSNFIKRLTVGYSGQLGKVKTYNMNESGHSLFVRLDFPSSSYVSAGYNIGNENFLGTSFDIDLFYLNASSQPAKFITMTAQIQYGGYPHYELLVQGDRLKVTATMIFQPTEKFASQFSYTRHIFHQRDTDQKLYDISIYFNKTSYQVNKKLSLRSIIEYNNSIKKLFCDALLEFTYIPGTVIHLGYGPTYLRGDNPIHPFSPENRFRIYKSTLFFKASYLFRF